MKAEVGDTPERSWSGLIWVWLCWLAVVVMLYVLSCGPALMMLDKGTIRSTSLKEQVISFYAPLDWAYDNTLLHQPLGLYLRLWAPRQFDSKGNPK